MADPSMRSEKEVLQREAKPGHVIDRGYRQRDRWLRRRGRDADYDLPDLRAGHDAGAKSSDGLGVHGGKHRPVLRSAAGVRGDPIS